MKNIINVNNLIVDFSKDDKYYVAYSPALNLSGFGLTKEEAKDDFTKVLDIFIDDLIENNKLLETLVSLGWTINKTELKPLVKNNRTRKLKSFNQNDLVNALKKNINYNYV